MTTKQTGFDVPGATDGEAMTTGNTAYTGNDAAGSSSSLGGCIFSTAAAVHGTFGLRAAAASGVSTWYDYGGYASTTMTIRISFTARTPTASTQMHQTRTTAGQSTGINYNASGLFNFLDSGGTSRSSGPSLTGGVQYQMLLQITSDASAGAVQWQIYKNSDHTLVSSGSFTGQNTRGGNLTNSRIGKIGATTDTGNYDFDDYEAVDGSTTPLSLVNSNPTAAFTDTAIGTSLVADGTSSTAAGTATISSYAWTFGDGVGTSTSSTPTYTYAAAGTYTVGLTVTDSNGLTNSVNHSVVITQPGTNVGVASVPLFTGWTPSSGTALGVLTDSDATTFLTSSTNPSSLELDVDPSPITPPPSGFPFVAAILADYLAGSSGSVTVELYEGGTLRSTVSGIVLTLGSGGTVSTYVMAIFPWSDISVIAAVSWNFGLTAKAFATSS